MSAPATTSNLSPLQLRCLVANDRALLQFFQDSVNAEAEWDALRGFERGTRIRNRWIETQRRQAARQEKLNAAAAVAAP